tara:strand:+ start:6519 stop:6731 length:213 start_codon:yes stop_codon:yes gene_type:complete
MSKDNETLQNITSKLECIDNKIDTLSKSVDSNTKDIIELKETVNMGRGAVRILAWIGTIMIAILGWRYTQ